MRKNLNINWKKGKNSGYFSNLSRDGRIVGVSSDGQTINGVLIKKNNFGNGIFFRSISEIQEFVQFLQKLLKNKKFTDLMNQVKVQENKRDDDNFLF